MAALTNPQDLGSSAQHEFRELLDEYARFLCEVGTKVTPYASPELPLFIALSPENQLAAITQVRGVLEVFRDVTTTGGNLKDTPTLLWRSLRQLRLTPSADIFGRMLDTDVVVIYRLDQRQIFQNLRFFDFVTLSLEELYCSEWYRYSKRPEWAEKKLYETAVAMAMGKVTTTVDPGVDEHLVEESGATGAATRFQIKVRLISPVQGEAGPAGAIVCNHCTSVGVGVGVGVGPA